jgi:multidrug resistance efflux pump
VPTAPSTTLADAGAAPAAPQQGRAAHALHLLGEVLAATDARQAAAALARALRLGWQADTVAVGWRRGERPTQLAACEPPLPQERHDTLIAALDEALDQGCALGCDPALSPRGPQGLQAIDLAQRLLAAGGGQVLTLPLAAPAGDDAPAVRAAVCLVRAEPWRAEDRDDLTHLLAAAAAALALQDAAALSAAQRLRQDGQRALHRLRHGPARWRWALGAVATAAVAALLLPVEAEVAGRARIEGAQQRVLAAPADGFLQAVHAQPGQAVKAGQVLVDLADRDLQIERTRWASALAQHENSYAAAMARADRGEAALALARMAEAEAQLGLADAQLQRAQLTAPLDGVVIEGDLSQRIGAPVKQGDALMTVADTRQHRVIVEVDETDIARLRPGQRGRLALSALPWRTLELQVLRITPLAQAVDGGNVYEVEARLGGPLPGELRPGLLGRAEVVTGREPLLWSATRSLVARTRVLAWRWLG